MSDKIIYTYVVDHGISAPSVGVGTVINGGQLIGVAFDDYMEKLERAESLIQEIKEAANFDDVCNIIDGQSEF